MRVTIASIYNRHCGIGQYTEHLAKQLKSQETEVVAYRKDGAATDLFMPYPYRSLRSLQYHIAPFYLQKAIQHASSDIWHADHVSSFMAIRGQKIKQPCVVTAHDAIPFHYGSRGLDFKIYKYQLKRTLKRASYVIVVSESAKTDLVSQTGINADKVIAIPNGINLEHFDPSLRARDHEHLLIRYLGGLGAEHKNAAMLLHTAKLLEDEGVPFSMELAGYLPEQHPLRDLKTKLGLNSVQFPGFIEDKDKASFLAQADLFVFPSLMEGFGFPPMEAMASGTPVLASKIPVFEELLSDGAMLVDPTPANFAKGIKQMHDSQELRETYGQQGLAQVKKYSWSETASKTMEVYHKSLQA